MAAKFKLEALLKVRKMKEDLCKAEIGRMQKQILELQDRISLHQEDIDSAYQSQEVCAKKKMSAREIQFYPWFVEGRRASIEQFEDELELLNLELEKLFMKLKELRGETKVIDDMKDRFKRDEKKKKEKKEFEKIEEQVLSWKHTQH